MRKLILCLIVVLLFAVAVFAQSRTKKQTQKNTKTTYYISVARCNAGQFSKKKWQQTANKLKRSGIPAFFANTKLLPDKTKEKWLLIQIIRRYSSAEIDALFLGPFSSKTAARNAVNKFPNLFSDEGYPLNENYEGEWSMGCFIMLGERTK